LLIIAFYLPFPEGFSFMALAPATAWTKLVGGTDYDNAKSVSTASDGSIYIAGQTSGNIDGQINNGGYDAFITKFNSDGTKIWTKLLGGTSGDGASSVSTASDGSIYIAGYTLGSIDGQINNGILDAFITKFNSDGTKIWTKLLGGAFDDGASSVSTASDGSIYIAGRTSSSIDGQINNGILDAFITKFNSDGTKIWTKLVGGTSYDYAYSVSTASDGSIYIAGYTLGSIDGQINNGGIDAFITKFNSDGTKIWTKLVGGTSYDYAYSVSTASDGSIYIAGQTPGNIDGQINNGGYDAFITKFNSDGTKIWTKLLGGALDDGASSVSTASDGSIYIAGQTSGNIDGQINNGEYDVFITKFNSDGSNGNQKSYTITPSSTSINEGSTLTTTVGTTNVASGTALYYSLSGTGITTADFSSGSLTGSGTVSSSGSFSFSHTLANDLTTEGTETLNIKLFSDVARTTQVGSTASVAINDTSTIRNTPIARTVDNLYAKTLIAGPLLQTNIVGNQIDYQFYNIGAERYGIRQKESTRIDEITGLASISISGTTISISQDIQGVFDQVTGMETQDAQVFRLYNAAFARFPDSSGLRYWINEYKSGISNYRTIAQSFINSNEFALRYGANNSNEEFINNMYKNVLGRLPDASGLAYWVGNLNSGVDSRVNVLGGFSESAENKILFSQATGFI